MCRFLAYLGPPATLHELLFAPEHSLVRQSYAPRHQRHGTVNADGFGVGWYDRHRRPEPARYRSDRPIWSDRSLASMAGLVASTAVVAAVRSATPPAPVEESGSPPFASGPWLFAHNGAVEGFAGAVGTALRGLVSEGRVAQVEGSADSAVVFALVLDALDRGADPGAALATALAAVEAVAPARLNLVLTDGTSIAATTCGDSLFVLDETGAGSDVGGRVTVASEPWDDDGRWREVPDRSLVTATRARVTVEPLPVPVPGPPG
ncbi:MAG: ergothioneine biosynthesis protein EgtC [Actinomycetota bacterium]|nr:ergothioneine biosynthesis protein EgtC [Actinomycetota bacterium]